MNKHIWIVYNPQNQECQEYTAVGRMYPKSVDEMYFLFDLKKKDECY